MKKYSFFLFVLVVLVLIIGCKAKEENKSTMASKAISDKLSGYWMSSCIPAVGGKSDSTSLIFVDGSFLEVNRNFGDSACSVFSSKSQKSGVYKIGSSNLSNSGLEATKLDLTTLQSDNSVNEELFTIFNIVDSNLYFGVRNNLNEGASENSRIKDLNFDKYFVSVSTNIELGAVTVSSGNIGYDGNMPRLAKESGCADCHDIDRKIIGPSWKDVSARYVVANEITRENLISKVKLGGKGNWAEITGGVRMPANSPRVKDSDIAALVDFILEL